MRGGTPGKQAPKQAALKGSQIYRPSGTPVVCISDSPGFAEATVNVGKIVEVHSTGPGLRIRAAAMRLLMFFTQYRGLRSALTRCAGSGLAPTTARGSPALCAFLPRDSWNFERLRLTPLRECGTGGSTERSDMDTRTQTLPCTQFAKISSQADYFLNM